MEKCERCRRLFDRGSTLVYGARVKVKHRFCSGTCALLWNRMSGPTTGVEIQFDPPSPFDRMPI